MWSFIISPRPIEGCELFRYHDGRKQIKGGGGGGKGPLLVMGVSIFRNELGRGLVYD